MMRNRLPWSSILCILVCSTPIYVIDLPTTPTASLVSCLRVYVTIFPILPLAWPLGMPHLCGFLSFSMLLPRHTIASMPSPLHNPHPAASSALCTLLLLHREEKGAQCYLIHPQFEPQTKICRGVASVINKMELSFLFLFFAFIF